MQQVLFTVSYFYIDELIIDEEDKSVWPLEGRLLTAPPSGEDLPEFAITEHSSALKPWQPKSETLASFYQQMEL